MRRYVGLIHEGKSGYGISFPDFPGCISSARSIEAVVEKGAEALRFHVEGMIEDGEPIPPPSSAETLRANPEFGEDFAESIVVLIPMLPPRAKAIRLNVSLDEELVSAIDRAAGKVGLTRSGFLAEAARRMLIDDTFDLRIKQAIEEAVRSGGRALDGISRIIKEDKKKSARNRWPPDISSIGKTHR
jgi:predicted RNase H-like HicB family nuclease